MGLSASIGGIRAESRLSGAALEADATLDSGAKGAGSALSWPDVTAPAAALDELPLLVPAGAVAVAGDVVALPAAAAPDPPDPGVVVLALCGVGDAPGSEADPVP